MRVVHVIPSLDLSDGGPAQALRSMVQIARGAGHDVSVVSTSYSPRAADERGWFEDAGVRLVGPPEGAALGGRLFGLPRLMGAIREADVVHVHGVFALATCGAGLICRGSSKPYILRPLGQLDPWSLSQKRAKKRAYRLLVGRRDLRGASVLHATSELEARGIAAVDPTLPTCVVPLCVDIPSSVERVPGHTTLRVLFLSRLHRKKGLETLLRAVADLVGRGVAVELTVAGKGEPEYVVALQREVAELDVGHVVRFVGFLRGADKERAFSSHDVFALPSQQENFAMAAAEALAHGLPVVLSDQVALADEVVIHDAGRVVGVGESRPLAEALASCVDAEARARQGANARELATRRYSRAAVSRRLLELYERVAGTRARDRWPAGR